MYCNGSSVLTNIHNYHEKHIRTFVFIVCTTHTSMYVYTGEYSTQHAYIQYVYIVRTYSWEHQHRQKCHSANVCAVSPYRLGLHTKWKTVLLILYWGQWHSSVHLLWQVIDTPQHWGVCVIYPAIRIWQELEEGWPQLQCITSKCYLHVCWQLRRLLLSQYREEYRLEHAQLISLKTGTHRQ